MGERGEMMLPGWGLAGSPGRGHVLPQRLLSLQAEDLRRVFAPALAADLSPSPAHQPTPSSNTKESPLTRLLAGLSSLLLPAIYRDRLPPGGFLFLPPAFGGRPCPSIHRQTQH